MLELQREKLSLVQGTQLEGGDTMVILVSEIYCVLTKCCAKVGATAHIFMDYCMLET